MIDLALRTDLSFREMMALQKHLKSKSLGEFMAEWHKNLWQVWAMKGPHLDMLVVTAVHVEDDEKELFLYKIIGKGWIKNLDLITKVLFLIAQQAGAKSLTGVVRSRALGRVYEKIGATHVSADIYKLELPNG